MPRYIIERNVGTISASGLYSAPSSIPSQQTITVKATSQADPVRFGAAALTLERIADGAELKRLIGFISDVDAPVLVVEHMGLLTLYDKPIPIQPFETPLRSSGSSSRTRSMPTA